MMDLNLLATLGALGAGIACALAGGAIGGALVAHRGEIDKSLGAWMGSFYGPLGAVPGVLLGLLVLLVLGAGGEA